MIHDTVIAKHVSPLSQEDAERFARIFKALSDPIRLQILAMLKKYGGVICVDEITDCFHLAQPTISHHLGLLRDANLVVPQKRGTFVFYTLTATAWDATAQVAAIL